jgi:hypothetical protein
MLILYGMDGTVAAAATSSIAIALWVPAIIGTLAFMLLRRTKGRPIVLRNPPEELRPEPH